MRLPCAQKGLGENVKERYSEEWEKLRGREVPPKNKEGSCVAKLDNRRNGEN